MITTGIPPVFLIGSKEYVKAEVEVETEGVELDDQPVTVWINGTEYPAGWIGDVGASRQCQTSSIIDFTSWDVGLYTVAVEVTDSPEIPLIPAGYISVQNP